MENEYNLEYIQINLKKKYLINLINACSKHNINSNSLKKELELTNIELQENYSVTEKYLEFSSLNNKKETIDSKKKINLSENVSLIYKDSFIKNKVFDDNETNITETETIDYLYLKPWSKLTQIHKIIKIKEFVNNLDINNLLDKDKLKEKLIDQIKEKKIKNKINYDETKGRIISISNLSFENNKYLIN